MFYFTLATYLCVLLYLSDLRMCFTLPQRFTYVFYFTSATCLCVLLYLSDLLMCFTLPQRLTYEFYFTSATYYVFCFTSATFILCFRIGLIFIWSNYTHSDDFIRFFLFLFFPFLFLFFSFGDCCQSRPVEAHILLRRHIQNPVRYLRCNTFYENN